MESRRMISRVSDGMLAGNPQEGPAGCAADGVVFQRDEPGERRQNGGVADLAQQGERADHQPVVGILQQILAVGVEHAEQQRSAIGAARQHAIDQRGVDGIQAGDEEFVEQAVRLQFAGDGFGFGLGRSGSAGRSPGSRLACASGSKCSFCFPSAA